MSTRVPQVTDRVRATPVQALRAVFASIGQLIVADRPGNQPPSPAREQAGPRGSGRGQRARKSRAGAAEPSRFRSLDQTGNVRLLSAAEMAEINAERAAVAAMKSAAAVLTPTPPAAAPEVPYPADLPVPNYDELAIASLRARLRNLDTVQLQVLMDYEQANAARPEILTMFERRIAKLGGA